jgi:anti-sigma B factor antagonist
MKFKKSKNVLPPKKEFGDIYFIKCVDFLDASNRPALDESIESCFKDNTPRIVLDFSELNYMASAGANAIISTLYKARALGGDLVILNPTQPVRDVISMLGMESEITIAPDAGTATRYFHDKKSGPPSPGAGGPSGNPAK